MRNIQTKYFVLTISKVITSSPNQISHDFKHKSDCILLKFMIKYLSSQTYVIKELSQTKKLKRKGYLKKEKKMEIALAKPQIGKIKDEN